MTRAQKRDALTALMSWPPALIRRSLDNPTPYMPPMVLTLHRLALRRKGTDYV